MKLDSIDRAILESLSESPQNPSRDIRERFGISKQSVTKRLQSLVTKGLIGSIGQGRGKKYLLPSGKLEMLWSESTSHLQAEGEDMVFREHVEPRLTNLPTNVRNILQHIFTEMLNNVIDHSKSARATIRLGELDNCVQAEIVDDGIGVFASIRSGFSLENAIEAVGEILKGRRTTDPTRHAGEGLFFSMRLADTFSISANGVLFQFDSSLDDWSIQEPQTAEKGTVITFSVEKKSERSMEEVFRRHTDDNFQFVRNRPFFVEPYVLKARGTMISRSEAKRFIAGAEDASSIIIDFARVGTIGQGFADEIFRIWARNHPEVELQIRNANAFIQMMVARSKAR